jgi:hypothetical protein
MVSMLPLNHWGRPYQNIFITSQFRFDLVNISLCYIFDYVMIKRNHGQIFFLRNDGPIKLEMSCITFNYYHFNQSQTQTLSILPGSGLGWAKVWDHVDVCFVSFLSILHKNGSVKGLWGQLQNYWNCGLKTHSREVFATTWSHGQTSVV